MSPMLSTVNNMKTVTKLTFPTAPSYNIYLQRRAVCPYLWHPFSPSFLNLFYQTTASCLLHRYGLYALHVYASFIDVKLRLHHRIRSRTIYSYEREISAICYCSSCPTGYIATHSRHYSLPQQSSK